MVRLRALGVRRQESEDRTGRARRRAEVKLPLQMTFSFLPVPHAPWNPLQSKLLPRLKSFHANNIRTYALVINFHSS